MERLVECAEHGRSPYALICVHLRGDRRRRFFATPRCKHGPAQAWCRTCDGVVAKARGWSDEATAFADWKLYCAECYRRQLRRHTFVQFSQGSDDDCDWSREPPPNA